MMEKLQDKEGIFRDSLVTNIRDLCELIPRLNFTDDARLEELRTQAEKDLAAYDPEDLRKNQFARMETADAAADLLAKMAGYTGIEPNPLSPGQEPEPRSPGTWPRENGDYSVQ